MVCKRYFILKNILFIVLSTILLTSCGGSKTVSNSLVTVEKYDWNVDTWLSENTHSGLRLTNNATVPVDVTFTFKVYKIGEIFVKEWTAKEKVHNSGKRYVCTA